MYVARCGDWGHGVNFINILRAAFTHTGHKSAKISVELTIFFVLLGPAHVNAASRMLMKLTLGVDFTNILHAAFLLKVPKSTKKTDNLTVFFVPLGSAIVKA